MKKIYYQKDKQKLIAVSAKKIKNHQILAKDYNDAEIKLLKKHLVLTRTMKKNLERLFSSSKNNLIWADVINGWLGYTYKSIVATVDCMDFLYYRDNEINKERIVQLNF